MDEKKEFIPKDFDDDLEQAPEEEAAAYFDENTLEYEEQASAEQDIPEKTEDQEALADGAEQDRGIFSLDDDEETSEEVPESVSFIRSALELLRKKDEVSHEETDCRDEVAKAEGTLESISRNIASLAASRQNERRQEIESEFDEQHKIIDKEASDTREERAKAKEEAIEERIQKENAPRAQENSQLKLNVAQLYADNNISKPFRGRVASALFFPENLIDWAIDGVFALVLCIFVPLIISTGLKGHPAALSIVIGLYALALFAVYQFILHSKMFKNRDVLDQAKGMRQQIKQNDKVMKSVAKEIREDTDESQYNLGIYDEQLSALHERSKAVDNARVEALRVFEEETVEKIQDEVAAEHEDERCIAEEDRQAAEQRLQEVSGRMTEVEDEIHGVYESVLGEDLMSESRLSELEQFCRIHPALGIAEAIDGFRNPAPEPEPAEEPAVDPDIENAAETEDYSELKGDAQEAADVEDYSELEAAEDYPEGETDKEPEE